MARDLDNPRPRVRPHSRHQSLWIWIRLVEERHFFRSFFLSQNLASDCAFFIWCHDKWEWRARFSISGLAGSKICESRAIPFRKEMIKRLRCDFSIICCLLVQYRRRVLADLFVSISFAFYCCRQETIVSKSKQNNNSQHDCLNTAERDSNECDFLCVRRRRTTWKMKLEKSNAKTKPIVK